MCLALLFLRVEKELPGEAGDVKSRFCGRLVVFVGVFLIGKILGVTEKGRIAQCLTFSELLLSGLRGMGFDLEKNSLLFANQFAVSKFGLFVYSKADQ